MAEKRRMISPYLEWAVRTEFAYLPGEWFWVLLELNEPAETFARSLDEGILDELIRVPPIYRVAPPPSLIRASVSVCMAIAHRTALMELGSERNSRKEKTALLKRLSSTSSSINRIELGTPTTNLFQKTVPREPRSLSEIPSTRTIVAVIDNGLAFAHERFRTQDGKTRLKYFWNQDDATNTNAPPGFGWGRQLDELEINKLLTVCTHGGLLDEEAFYQLSGQRLAARRATHGTHVMDIACGNDLKCPSKAPGATPDIIGVQLPMWVTEETSGAFLTPLVYAAITYVLGRADQIAADEGTGPIPVVVNLSYGTIAGPHDGTGQFEAAIEELISARETPLRVVLPAGNHYLSRCHASFALPIAAPKSCQVQRLGWRAQPDSRASSFMEIWLPTETASNALPEIAVRITTPTNEASPWISANEEWEWPATGKVRFLALYQAATGERPHILLAMAPTVDFAQPTAPSGLWLVEIKNKADATIVEAWIQRGDTPFGYPLRGRQSRFDDADYVRFDLAGRPEQEDTGPSPILRRSTINALATGRQSIVAGSFRRSDRKPSGYSGAGRPSAPGAPPVIRVPDLSGASDDSFALKGVLAAGSRTGSVVAMNGTSVAAPQATRLIAMLMASRVACDRADVQREARAGDTKAPGDGTLLGARLGSGRIDMTGRPKRRRF
jgi:hypothetical protein